MTEPLDTSPRRTRQERAELAVQRAQRDYSRRVIVHARALRTVERAYVQMTAAATRLEHKQADPDLREADPALQDTEEES